MNRTHYIVISSLFLLFFVAIAVTADLVLHKQMENVQQRLLSILSEESASIVTYQSLNVQGLGIHIEDLTLSDPDNSDRELVRVGSTFIFLSLFEVLWGGPEKITINKIELSNLRSSLDLEQDRAFINNLQTKFQQNNVRLQTSLLVNLDNINLNLLSANKVILQLRNFSSRLQWDPLSLNASGAATLVFFHAGQQGHANLRFNSVVDNAFATSETDLTLFDIRYNNLNLVAQHFIITMKENEIAIRNMDTSGLYLESFINSRLGTWETSVILKDFIPETLILTTNNSWRWLLETHIQGTVHIRANRDNLEHYVAIQVNNILLPSLGLANLQYNSTGTKETLSVDKLLLQVPNKKQAFSLHYNGVLDLQTLIPTGTFALRNFPVKEGLFLSSGAEISRNKTGGVHINSTDTRFGTLRIPHVLVELLPGNNQIDGILHASLYKRGYPRQLSVDFSLHNNNFNKFTISINNLPLRPLLPLLSLSTATSEKEDSFKLPILENPTLSSKTLTLKYSQGSVILTSPSIILRDKGHTLAEFDLLISNKNIFINAHSTPFSALNIAVRNFQIVWKEEEAQINAGVSINSFQYTLNGSYQPNNECRLYLHSPDRQVAAAQFFTEHTNDLIFTIAAERFPLHISNIYTLTSFRVDGTIRNTVLNVDIQKFQLEYPSVRTRFSFNAKITGNAGVFDSITFQQDTLILRGQGSMNLNNETLCQFLLSNPLSDEQYTLTALQGEKISLQFTATDVPGYRIGLATTGLFNIHSNIHNISDPLLNLALSYEDTYNTVLFKTDMVVSKNTVSITNLSGQYSSLSLTVPQLIVNLQTGDILGEAHFINSDNSRVNIAMQGLLADYEQPASIFDLQTVRSSTGEINLLVQNLDGKISNYEIIKDNSFFRINSINSSNLSLILRSDKQLRATIDYANFKAQISGLLGSDNLSLTTRIDSLNLQTITPLNFGPLFRFDSGILQGYLTFEGSMKTPAIGGEFLIAEATAKTVFSPAQLGPATLYFAIEENVLYLRESYVPVINGGGTVKLDLRISEKNVPVWNLEIASKNSIGLFIDYNFVPIYAKGYATGKIRISNDKENKVHINGNIAVENSIFSLVENTVVNVFAENLFPVPSLDLKISSRNGVRFTWPWKKTPIFRGTLHPNETLHIFLDPENNEQFIAGNLNFLGGDIFYFSKNFYLKSASLLFNKNSFTLIPRVSLKAEMQMQTTDGSVRIFLEAINQNFSTLTPDIYSDPPMPQNELVTLLGKNFLPDNTLTSSYTNISDLLIYSTDIFTQFNIINNFENILRDSLRVDLFSLRTPIIQNILSSVLEQTLNPAAPLINPLSYFANTAIVIGKYIGKNIFTELTLTLDERNQDIAATSLIFQTQLRMSINTPLLNVEWLLKSEDITRPNLTDTQIGISWTYRD